MTDRADGRDVRWRASLELKVAVKFASLSSMSLVKILSARRIESAAWFVRKRSRRVSASSVGALVGEDLSGKGRMVLVV